MLTDRAAPVAAMVIGSPNCRVNRIRQAGENPREMGVSVNPRGETGRGVQIRFIAMLKLLFKFDRS
jgi:hypothetical protein